MSSSETSPEALVAAQLLAHLGPESGTPLTPLQFRALAAACAERRITLSDAIAMTPAEIQENLGLTAEWLDKLPALENRGMRVALDLERLAGHGIRALCDSDPDYPRLWREKLAMAAPPLVFACGHPSVWNANTSVSVAGSRDVAAAGQDFAIRSGREAAELGAVTVTGGARGVDKLALEGALEAGGKTAAVLPADMMSAVKHADPALVGEGRIAMLSPVHPKMAWTAGLAMARNRLIYCLSRVGVIVSAGLEEGGTWSGAREVLKNGWVPLLVMAGKEAPPGNLKLISFGGHGVEPDTLATELAEQMEKALAGEASIGFSNQQKSFSRKRLSLGY